MGLDLYCGEVNFYISYSGVHSLRLTIIKGVLKYIQENKDNITANMKNNYGIKKDYCLKYYNKALKYLKKLVKPIDGGPNYKVINNKDNENLKLVGIYSFIPIIYHSDSEGYYTYGEVVEFFELLQKIYIYFEKDNFYDEEIKLENFIPYEIFKECYDTKKLISFC